MASPYLHPFSTTASTASLANTTSSATTIINNRRPFNTPSSTVAHSHLQTPSNPQVPSSSSILTKWPELPKTVMICELSEYIPNDSFGRNAKRNENYARARLVALREHQQILVGFLSDLLALEQYQRMEEQVLVAAMDSARQGNSARATAAPMAFSPIERAAGVPKKAKADPRLEPTAALMIGESECTCNCERRHRLLLEKRHAAIRAYQRAILDLWQTDQNMCYWLSRYIRTIRHIGRGLDYMIAAILEGNRSNSCDTKPSAPLCSFRCPPNLGVLEGVGNTSFTREALFNTCSLSGVSNPELERMGILQTKLINYNAGMSYNKGGAGIGGGNGNGGHSSQVLANVVAPPSRTHPDSSTLGNIDSQPSLASQHGYMLEISRALPRPFFSQSVDQHTIPAIRINSPELLFKPLPKVLDGANAAPVSTSAFPNTSYRTPFAPSSGDKAMTSTSDVATAGTTTTASFTDAALTPVNTISNNNNNSNSVSITVPGRIFPTFSGPLSNESIRELVTLSAPVVPPPAVPAPNRPRPPTSWNHPASTIASAAILSAALTAAKDTESNDTELLSSLSPSLLLPPILELNPLHNSHDVHPFDYVPVSGTSSNHSEHSVPRHIETVDHSTSQSAKANELLLQFNKESHRSFGVLQRYEAARQAFERRVLGLSADCGSDVS
ncbi:hypothetical protein EC991_011068 [Linnemannia zychae]|nr:hypothetical protein EC991_011068 [Linnemannia zychae]